jgi:putative hydrolase of HD superfamily
MRLGEAGGPVTVSTRLESQITFLRELDALKGVLRRTSLADRSRLENSAEHSWHMTAMAVVLAEHAPADVDVARVMRMIVMHDVVEIDAGDTFAFDAIGHADKSARERAAADRIFGLLPADLAGECRALWDEFEHAETPDARMANALDRFAALLQNSAHGDGGTWREHRISRAAVMRRMDPIREGLPALWPYVLSVIDTADAAGVFGADAG